MLIGLFFVVTYMIIIVPTQGNVEDEVKAKTNVPPPVPDKILNNVFDETKITVASEGGAIISNTPVLSLPNENQEIPMTSENESSSNKIKARKGAHLNAAEDSEESSSDLKQLNSTSNPHQTTEKNMTVNLVGNDTKVNAKSDASSPETNIKRVHKPMIVSVDAIAKSDEMNKNPAVDGEDRDLKIDKVSSSGHPGMIMPIVITILVVPMFAVIGYMVLKRGQEAWKNRHYKRMDFLLDGMYND